MQKQVLDTKKVDDMADKLMAILNHGAMALGISIGHRSGLFDTMSDMNWATSEEIARQASLNERYVREWLASMTVGRIVDYDEDDQSYHLPLEHSALLTRNAAPDNIAVFAQYIGLLGSVENKVLDCFYHGGGVDYADFPCFHHIMAEDSGQTVVAALQGSILPLIPGLEKKLETGIDVLDVGCGSGLALIKMAEMFPNSQFTGYDFSTESIKKARQYAELEGLKNIHFEIQDAATLDEQHEYDLITVFDAIHDQADPAKVLNNIYQALRPGGHYLMQDIAASSHVQNNMEHPISPLLYTLSYMHCMSVSLAQGGVGLGTMWGKELALDMLNNAGFGAVRVEQLEHDFQNYYYLAEKAAI